MNERLLEECKKYLGIKPYDTDFNIVKYDPYYIMQLEKVYGKEEVKQAIEKIKRNNI